MGLRSDSGRVATGGSAHQTGFVGRLLSFYDGVLTWTNITVTGDGDTLWSAAEANQFELTIPDPFGPTEPFLHLVKYNGATDAVLQWKGTYSSVPVLVNQGIYPSALTWGGYSKVLVATKESALSSPYANTGVIVQPRADLLLSPTFEEVDGLYHHNKPVLAYDSTYAAQFLCWTRENLNNSDDQDVDSKVKDQSTWNASTSRLVSAEAGEEDHCAMAFHVDGSRYLVYHSDSNACDDAETCTNGIDDDGDGLVDEQEDELWVKVTKWDGVSWTDSAHFQLPGSPDNDFPTIWAIPSPAAGRSIVTIAGQGNANNSLWECDGAVTGCNQPGEFSKTSLSSLGAATDPKVFTMRRGAIKVDRFLVYQTAPTEPRVRIAKKCDGDSGWSAGGVLPLPDASYLSGTDMHLGTNVSSTNPQVYVKGGINPEFWVTFLGQDPRDGAEEADCAAVAPNPCDPGNFFNGLVYHSSPADFDCL